MPAPTPNVIVEPFGLNAANPANLQLPIPVPSQLPGNPGNASFNDGFPPDTMLPVGSGGIPPRGQDMNGILYMVTAYLQALTGGQFWPFNSTWEAANGGYAVGAIVSMANSTGLWLNTVANNANNPDTTAAASSGWVPLVSYGSVNVTGLTGGNVTLTAVQASYPMIYLLGTLTSNLTLIFPAWLKAWRIVNNTSGNFTVTCKTASGTGVLALPFGTGFTQIYGDGTNILLDHYYGTGTFTGGLTGCTTTPTVTVLYSVNGTVCSLYSALGNNGTSNTNTLTMTGLPAAVQPANQQYALCGMEDNGNFVYGTGFIMNGGSVINFAKFQVSGTDVDYSNANDFTTSGIKGVPPHWNMRYPLL
jgi:hypothetical protein